MRGSPKCIFNAAPSTSHHLAVGTMTRPRLLHRPGSSLQASFATPFRAAIAFLQSSCRTHFNKDRVDLNVQQHCVRCAIFDSGACSTSETERNGCALVGGAGSVGCGGTWNEFRGIRFEHCLVEFCMNVFVPNSFPVYPLVFLGGRSLQGSLRRSHVEDAPKCIFRAAPSSSHHFVVGTMTRPRFLQYKPACEFSSAASCAKPFRAAIAFLQSSCKTHFNKDGVDLNVQQHFVRSAELLYLLWPAGSAAHRRRSGTDVFLLRKLLPLVAMGRGTSFAAADLSIVLLSSA